MFQIDILIHSTSFSAKVDRAKLQHMISCHGHKSIDADRAVMAIDNQIDKLGYCQQQIGDHLYHVTKVEG